MITRPALVLLLLAALTACGGGGAAGSPAPSSGPAVPTAVTTSTAAAATGGPDASAPASPGGTDAASEPPPPTSTEPVRVERGPTDPPIVTGVRYAAHDGYDRVVIELKGQMTGYTADWVDKLLQDGSGTPVSARGGAYLQLTLVPASAHDLEGRPTWPGPRQVAANLPNVTRIVNNGDFEGVVSVGLVLDHRAPFRVTEQRGPTRLVIDVGR
ncbi:hypothetical protein GCM10009530_72200 [Microbispora corallina]|uniref:AMIN-like domain-containing protein n=1 Tax=Microbispora corallina TaxID=83302 RepID=A0ABQ4G4G8_9ACTN|nr:hypothetical protein [Microbispora corallina]GIH41932.1 hypothetical protein Mco01_49320 [Microbispora corallina]